MKKEWKIKQHGTSNIEDDVVEISDDLDDDEREIIHWNDSCKIFDLLYLFIV